MNPLPPAAPTIPVGTTTKVGLGSAALLAVVAGISAIIGGDHTAETITTVIMSGGTILTVLAGRYAQAYAMYRDAPSPKQLAAALVEDPPAKTALDHVGVPVVEAEIEAIVEQVKAVVPKKTNPPRTSNPSKKPTTERSKRPA